MRVTSRGQITIPLNVRRWLDIEPGDQVDFMLDGHGARLVRRSRRDGLALVERMRGRATTPMSTDEIMALIREEG
jgi:AbrB family looped-hinge helix DNA binding protein